jgi:hypothetical protein
VSKTNVNSPSFAASTEIVTFRYRGPDRRALHDSDAEQKFVTEIRFDAKGNPIWEMRATLPRRRADDDTVDLLKCLDIGSLSLADAKDEPEGKHETDGYDPYHRDKRR